ncbi:hypothetical protein GCM10009714_20910 [Microlunatus capsulatus]
MVQLRPAVLAGDDEVGLLEQAQVLGHAEAGHLHVLVDGGLELTQRAAVPLVERVQEQSADGVCQSPEHEVVGIHTRDNR